ncbi:hypothetical protein SOCE26_007750 [Sorangium cellulosum]|uniref:Uncharacterized protein n=1 Tax=Sorangium cellulosum TaxID=56 RepID=A0A2L0EJE5_SORCE|nr:hypothetical protein [Sorangium cellulosum]AUX39384.1 hypothetical protein SOCE26_007750 [Sorangium cellulosum]
MKHSINQLLDIVYQYYPRETKNTDDVDKQLRSHIEEHARLVAARLQASKDERWHSMLRRIEERLPGMLMNHSLHLPTGGWDGCYSFSINLSRFAGRTLWFQVSFLAPYYITHGASTIEIVKQLRDSFVVKFRGVLFIVSRSPLDPKLISNPDHDSPRTVVIKQQHVTFELSPDEQRYADWIANDIEATFGCERMPPEVGTVFVPDVKGGLHPSGVARIYDCLFSDQHQWVKPSPSEVPAPRAQVDASRLTERFIAVLTVLWAHYHIGLALRWPAMLLKLPKADRQSAAVFHSASTDGFLHKDKIQEELARMRPHDHSPETLRAMAAKRELEALVEAWDGEGEPPASMVAWASSFLASWDVGESS